MAAKVTARHILIATGGTPVVPEQWQGQGVLTSNEVFLDGPSAQVDVDRGRRLYCQRICLPLTGWA